MNLLTLLLVALSGYLAGSLSFAHLILRGTKGKSRADSFTFAVRGGEAGLTSTAKSATAVRVQNGAAAGCLVGLLDMAKAAVPVLLLRLWWPQTPYYVIFATTVVVGHIWPLYHRFDGGRGQSPIIGGMLVLDWGGVLVTNLAALLLGISFNILPLIMSGGMLLMIPWLLVTGRDWTQVAYAILVNVLHWFAMRSELKQYLRLRRDGHLARRTDLAAFMGMSGLERLTKASQLAAARFQLSLRRHTRDGDCRS